MLSQLHSLLSFAVSKRASDLHLSACNVPWLRIDGVLQPVADAVVLANEQLEAMLHTILNDRQSYEFKKNLEIDFAYNVTNLGRFRVNIFQKHGGIAAVFRVIATEIPSLNSLQLPKVIEGFSRLENGLVLITGPTGSGKTTTLASILDYINCHEARHIITIEDPIEYVHQNKLSLINQREVGRDTLSFQNALRVALREDPDILLVGELRDLVTIRLALTAAETGHLVFATLHTVSAAKSITRMVDVFPGNEQALVRTMLADSLRVVVTQMLCKRSDSGRIAATEVMFCTPAISNLIRENKISQINSQIQTGAAFGMHTLEQDLQRLGMDGVIIESFK